MKLTTRRFGRSTGHEVVDEGMGGGDYPIIVSDLSVHPSGQLIPEQVYPELAPTQEPPNGGDDGNFWTTVGTEPEHKPRPWWRQRTTYIVATVLVTVVAVVTSLIAFSGGQVQTKRIAYTFPVEAFPDTGVTVSRTWTLYPGQHPALHGDLTFYSSRSDQVTVEELLPSSLVTQASNVTFIPKPKVVSEDPVVVSYTISSALDGVTSAEYTIPLPKGSPFTLAALHQWAAEQSAQAGQRYLRSHTLASIHLTPGSIVVKKGGASYQLALSGLQSDNSAAPTIAFGSAKWSVANSKIAKVSSKGLVTGLAPGRTTVRAVVGKLSATATVVVSAAEHVRVTPPLKTAPLGPLTGLGGPNSIPSSIGILSTGPVNNPVNTPVTKKPATKPPVHSNPVPVHTNPAPPPVQCTSAPAPATVSASQDPASTTTVDVNWSPVVAPTGCTFGLYSVTATVNGATFHQDSVTGTSFAFSGLPPGGVVQVFVAAAYTGVNGPVNSTATGSNQVTLPALPPPPPTCDPATQEFGPSNLAATPTVNPDEFTITWTGASVAAGSPCALSGETALLDGSAVTNGSVLTLTTGPHTLVVTATFADGNSPSQQLPFDAA